MLLSFAEPDNCAPCSPESDFRFSWSYDHTIKPIDQRKRIRAMTQSQIEKKARRKKKERRKEKRECVCE
jgi:hypothetical protein